MLDFFVLRAVRDYLQKKGGDVPFYLTRDVPESSDYCVVALDDSLSMGRVLPLKIKFKIICFQEGEGMKKIMDRVQDINAFLEGSVLSLKGGESIVIKPLGNQVDLDKSGKLKTVTSFYESLVRGKRESGGYNV